MRLCLLLLPALAACAVPRVPDPRQTAPVAGRATILAIRPIVPADTVLTMIGGQPGGARAAAGGRREVVLRTDAGRIISIVAEDDGRWRAGRVVTVIEGDRAGLALPD